jgi:hypothetical protein
MTRGRWPYWSLIHTRDKTRFFDYNATPSDKFDGLPPLRTLDEVPSISAGSGDVESFHSECRSQSIGKGERTITACI